jgi:hypothetical protein
MHPDAALLWAGFHPANSCAFCATALNAERQCGGASTRLFPRVAFSHFMPQIHRGQRAREKVERFRKLDSNAA